MFSQIKKIVYSPFLIVGTLIGIISTYFAADAFFSGDSSASLVVFLYGVIAFISFVTVILEQLLFRVQINKGLNLKMIWFTESIVLLLLLSYFLFQRREIIYQIDEGTQWFAVVENKKLNSSKGTYSFPFNKEFKVPKNAILCINPNELEGFNRSDIQGNKACRGIAQIGRTINVDSVEYSMYIYFPYNANTEETRILQVIDKVKYKLTKEVAH